MIRCGACNKKFDVPEKLSAHIKSCQVAKCFLENFKSIIDFVVEKESEKIKKEKNC